MHSLLNVLTRTILGTYFKTHGELNSIMMTVVTPILSKYHELDIFLSLIAASFHHLIYDFITSLNLSLYSIYLGYTYMSIAGLSRSNDAWRYRQLLRSLTPSTFWAHLCILHSGLICIAFCPSVCHWIIIHISESIIYSYESETLPQYNAFIGAYRKNTYYTLGRIFLIDS